ncbi:G-type lectin S-receptor-like serine/threonine-protein kinase At1g11330 isoform X2 [Momordica charantia]|uniref:Receptor-like serine/threonine-protein kinase n=1 Tax=Momordica charantia TaxID=3673 RepID=A0A6J1CFS5_MOMCH|nr:G-type lectin S-receptor-like serine/threonine-protein kinase At1g11330 isoform X2 [Momordica charantia]
MEPISNTIPFLLLLLWFVLKISGSIDSITSTKILKDPETVLSNRGFFELGFFSPPNSTYRYLGIWCKRVSVPTVVWVANRDKPLKNKSGVFAVSNDGNLVVLDDEQNKILWNSSVSNAAVNSTARLLDSGNLILQDPASGTITWESFKNPSDKFLPMMKFITNTITNQKVEIVSWKSPSDPSSGNFSFGIDPLTIPEVVIWKNGRTYWRSGPWDGQVFIGIPGMNSDYLHGGNLVIENKTYSLSVANANEAQLFFYYLNPKGILEENQWDTEEQKWEAAWTAPETECDVYGACGAFGVCNSQDTSICSCLKGFRPKKAEEWNRGNWTSGCARNLPLECEKNNSSEENGREDGFLKVEMVKVPDFADWIVASEDECRVQCLSNCSCSAYTYKTGIGCMIWRGDLIDIQNFKNFGVDIYVRVAYSDLADESGSTTKDVKAVIIASVISGTFILICCIYCFWKRKSQLKFLFKTGDMKHDKMDQVKLQELPLFDFEKLETATNHFHFNNKLGEGGFGPVYKGKLVDGQEIAVKRLSKTSGQGLEEFTNEVMVISKLQHRNLVQLLGCCMEGEERMLVYEYMPNGSLDSIIFDSKKKNLDWRKRLIIIEEIVRGLLYLHRDSRLKIIHRDLKASNILLDRDLNPKISDFGTARIFYSNEAQANTTRVVGTYGYMSPEYVMKGQFSEKSDVFSFGVLLLEIISGRKNTSFYDNEHALNLLGFAWKLWMEDNLVALIDQTMFESDYKIEISRSSNAKATWI